ncbi:MAG: MaoC family dehydratase N-terminal domain-containing protein [Anaerolineaceae bacterium]|nr:MaoC family dehydratase N-terminal domain-containing protein [Anaerolineaceae bacterium]
MREKRALEIRKGLFFEEFVTGETVSSAGRTVTEADIVGFAALIGDWNPIHSNAEYAAQTIFGQRVAHGMLGLSFATGLAMRTGILDDTILAFREVRGWKFSQPIFIGDTIHLEIKIGETRSVPPLGGGIVTLHGELINQRGQLVQQGDWVVLVKTQDPG